MIITNGSPGRLKPSDKDYIAPDTLLTLRSDSVSHSKNNVDDPLTRARELIKVSYVEDRIQSRRPGVVFRYVCGMNSRGQRVEISRRKV